jgi:hypothetical protein
MTALMKSSLWHPQHKMTAIEVKKKTTMISKWWQAIIFDKLLFSVPLIHFFSVWYYSESLWSSERDNLFHVTHQILIKKNNMQLQQIETVMSLEDQYKLALWNHALYYTFSTQENWYNRIQFIFKNLYNRFLIIKNYAITKICLFKHEKNQTL